MESIEDKEQALIQHLRTAGLRQPKEIALVDEVLEIRKERRRLYAGLQERVGALEAAKADLTQQVDSQRIRMVEDLDSLKTRYESELGKRDEAFRMLERSLREEKDLQSENVRLTEKKALDKLKHGYEAKLALLEGKLQEILAEKQSGELKQARALANSIAQKVTGEIEERYHKKLSEYKASVASVMEREAKVTETVKAAQQRVSSLEQLNGDLEEQLTGLREQLARAARKEKALEAENLDLLSGFSKQRKQLEQALLDMQQSEQRHQAAARDMQAAHEQSLQDIDDKIRKQLDHMAAEVSRYKAQYEQEVRKNRQMVEDMADLRQLLG